MLKYVITFVLGFVCCAIITSEVLTPLELYTLQMKMHMILQISLRGAVIIISSSLVAMILTYCIFPENTSKEPTSS